MSKIKRTLSAFLAFAIVLGMFSCLGGIVAPKASAAEGTSSVKTYAELAAQYDNFIYLATDAYETVDGNLVLSDGYVQPGDLLTFRLYFKSDRYIGSSTLYQVCDFDFFDNTRVTGAAPNSSAGFTEGLDAVSNSAHPMVSGHEMTFSMTSNQGSNVAWLKTVCLIDTAVLATWGTIQIVTNTTPTSPLGTQALRLNQDIWMLEFYLTVKEGLAEGTTGTIRTEFDVWMMSANPKTGVAPDKRKRANVYSLPAPASEDAWDSTVDENSCGNMAAQYNSIQAFLYDDLTHTFTIGNPPAAGSYTATFTVDGETYGDVATYATGASIAAPATNPTKDGYRFLGWALDGTTDVLTFPQTMGSANVVYTAVFEALPTHTATFKVDGAVYGDVISYTEGATITAPTDPTKTGYSFTGWNPTVGTMGAADMVFNATFKANTYSVKYYKEKTDSTPYQTLSVSFDGAYNLPATPTKTGYVFSGWVDASGNSMPATHTTDADVSFYASWTAGSYNAVFNANGGQFADGSDSKTVTTTFGEAIVAPDAPTKTGFDFAGWEPTVGTMDAEGKTFTAQWTAKQITVYFMDGETELGTKSGDYGSSVAAINNPSKDGYTFAGWQYADGSTATFPITLGSENVYVYAKWTAKAYYIEFFGPNTTDWISGGDQYCGEPIVAPNAPTKSGYRFTGWADAEGNPMPETVPPIANQQYFAQYEAQTYDAVFYVDGEVYDTQTGIINSSIVAPNEPTKTGYTFSKWVKVGSTTAVKFPAKMPNGGVNYEAVFTINSYNINYYVDGTLVKTESYNYGADVTPYTYTPAAGQSFSGWGDQVPATMPANDVNVYGTTGVNTYNVTFTVNGETYQVVPFAYGATVTAPDYTVPEGHTFSGWTVPSTMPAQDITLDATLTANTYYAIFYLDEAKTNEYTRVPTVYGQEIQFPVNPEVAGMTFGGWDNTSTVMGAGDMEFVAILTAIEYNISFVNEDGTPYDGGSYDNIYYYNDSVEKPDVDPVKEGYSFKGWKVNGSVVTFPYTVTEDVTFTASFGINGYDIIYMVDGKEYTRETHQFGDAITIMADLTKEGYTFSGWDITLPSTMPANDITVNGTFTVNQYDAVFNAGEGAEFEGGLTTVTVPTNYGEIPVAPVPTKAGYNFVGWEPALAPMGVDGATYTAKFSAGNVAYTVETYTMGLDGNYGTADTQTLYGETDQPVTYDAAALEGFTVDADNSVLSGVVAADGSLVLKVYYIRNQYTFKTVIDGVEAPVTYYYGAAVAAPETPAKTGYTFDGWDNAVPTTMPANDVTLTAQFTINQYTITFVTDGGTVIAPITQDYATAIDAPSNPTKTGYTFNGWDTEIPATMPAGDMTITAKWTINQYTITFVTDGGTPVAPITQDYATAVAAPSDPTKTGYTFKGWDIEIPATMPAENLTITAQWEVNYYDAIFIVDGVETRVSTAYGQIPVIDEPTKVGYTFMGWDNELVPMVVGGATYTADFEANIYDAIFDANEGKFSDGKTSVTVKTVFDTQIIAPSENPTREGYNFAGWTPEVGMMTTEGITFKAVWEQDLNYCRVQNVVRTTENVYEPGQRAVYVITVQGSPVKLQIVCASDTAFGWTYYRSQVNPEIGVTLSEAGLVAIKQFNAADEEITDASADKTVAYEKWYVIATLSAGEYKVRAKVDYNSDSWESLDFAYDYTCVLDERPVGPTMINSVVLAKSPVKRAEYTTLTLVVNEAVSRIRTTRELEDGSSQTVSYIPSLANVTVTANGDGTNTWVIKLRFTYSGTALEQIQNWDIWYCETGKSGWTKSDKSFEVKVTRYAQNPSPAPGYAPYSIISVTGPTGAVVEEEVAFTVVTTSDVTMIRLNDNNGNYVGTYQATSSTVTKVDDAAAGTSTWTLKYRFFEEGEQTWSVQSRGNEWSAATSFTFSVAPAEE